MIGKALSKNEMRKLVNHMGEIDQPWVNIAYKYNSFPHAFVFYYTS